MARKKKIEELEHQIIETEMEEEFLEEEVVEEATYQEGILVNENGEELLMPGGPTIEQVEKWKSMYNDEVYLTEFDNEVFLWRPITRKEFKDIMKLQNADSFYREERICEKCVLFPEQYNFSAMVRGKAGIPTVLSELIMEKSGFVPKQGSIKL